MSARYLMLAVAPTATPASRDRRSIHHNTPARPMSMRQSVCPKYKSLRTFPTLNRRAAAEISHGMEESLSFSESRQLSDTFLAAIIDAAKMIIALRINQTFAATPSGNAARG